jgi:hypothetical protein
VNYDETRSKYASDEEMARALCGMLTETLREKEQAVRYGELQFFQRCKAETQLYLTRNPIPKQYKEHA